MSEGDSEIAAQAMDVIRHVSMSFYAIACMLIVEGAAVHPPPLRSHGVCMRVTGYSSKLVRYQYTGLYVLYGTGCAGADYPVTTISGSISMAPTLRSANAYGSLDGIADDDPNLTPLGLSQ
jgi:hypothetical protein